MNDGIEQRANAGRKAIIKAAVLVIFIISAVYIIRFTPVKNLLTQEVLGSFLEAAGFWAPLIFMFVYAAGICLFVPGTLLTALGAAIFGPYWGFLYVWVGAMVGASAAFWIGRTLGRDFAASLIGDRLKKYDDAIERNGFAAVLYLRLVYFPFTPMNFGMGLTKVRFWDYFFGTGLGIIAGTFIFTFFFGTLKEVWAGGDWGQLFSFKVFFSIALFVFSFFIPKIIKRSDRRIDSHSTHFHRRE
ncbi:MAG TPA: TVP38/TMEM64 family protein [Syntrophales bacterium]|nr:TVP38/TMEM64 family protein [Syntrophales bacterium]